MGFAKPIEQYLFSNLLIRIHVFMYLKDIIRDKDYCECGMPLETVRESEAPLKERSERV
jgi:hypothetical protein